MADRKERTPRELLRKLEQFIDESRDPEGRWSKKRGGEVHQKLTGELLKNPLRETAEDQAVRILDAFDKGRKFSPRKGQGLLFDEYALLALGDDERIELGRARPMHVIRHIQVLTAEMQVSAAAFQEKLGFFNDRLEYAQDGDTMLDIEKRHFGYFPDDEDDEQ